MQLESKTNKNMLSAISSELAELEKSEDVRILFAVESGSRAWGFASPDSDYDVRLLQHSTCLPSEPSPQCFSIIS